MKLVSRKLAVAALALIRAGLAIHVTILADTNRDGKVDSFDSHDKIAWTEDLGALFLANLGDSEGRCSSTITGATDDADLETCHDASDNVLRNPHYLAPLVTLPIAGLSPAARGSLTIEDTVAAEKVRIFQRKPNGDWVFVSSNHSFTAAEIGSGLQFGIDGRDIRRAGGWDGRVTITFTVTDRGSEAQDAVALRVAPVLTHHHSQLSERLFVTSAEGSGFPRSAQVQFVKDLKQNAANAGITTPVYEFVTRDIWTQDFFEAAYTSMPGPDGPIVIRIMLRSAQLYREAGRRIYTDLRSEAVGAVNTGDGGGTIDATGNLETIPPYTLNGVTYPAGRIIMGTQRGRDPEILPLLEAQETQKPVRLDTTWLSVGHVDEFLQFLPANNERGWVLMLDDPLLGLEILQRAVADGHGNEQAFFRPKMSYDDVWECLPNFTINQVLARNNFTDYNNIAAARITANLRILEQETGITDGEIFRIPALYYHEEAGCGEFARVRRGNRTPLPKNIIEASTDDRVDRRQSGGDYNFAQVFAFYPGIINGLVLSDSVVLAPNPWGPIINGKDILRTAAEEAYAQANYNVTWQDDWYSHHVMRGEIHCGTNTWRNADAPWW
ncbi:Protein-arginine deiminase type-4 [Paramyrothecium foliicola]|nr:Protein-arginine deiminase type-4 [Paramyrothecium foliicola]